jgi:mannan polymerase II complex MNN11 subunit
MHSALPTTIPSKGSSGVWEKGTALFQPRRKFGWLNGQSRQNAINGVLAILALAATVYLCLSVNFVARRDQSGSVRSGADTMTIVETPYIYPDLSLLSEYRTSQWLTLVDGTTVLSRKHSYVFRPKSAGQSPSIVLVVGLNSDMSQSYLEEVLENRLAYAKQHGYGFYARYLKDFTNEHGDKSSVQFAKVSLMREAIFAFKECDWLWWLDQDAIIMDSGFDLKTNLLAPDRLSELMLRDVPITPPDSVIHSYKRIPAEQVRFIASRNDRGISTASFLVSNDVFFGQILLDYWRDPLHRSYHGFRVFKGHNGFVDASLTHMVQWHPAILSRMALVDQSILGGTPDEGLRLQGQKYQDGGFIYLLHSANDEHLPDGEEIAKNWATAKSMKKEN